MVTNIKILGVGILFLGLGCASGPLQDSDMEALEVSTTQKSQLNGLMLEIERQMMKVPDSELSPDLIERAMTDRASDIAGVLDSDQFSAYQTDHRALFARQIYRSVRARHRRVVQETIRSQESGVGAMLRDPT